MFFAPFRVYRVPNVPVFQTPPSPQLRQALLYLPQLGLRQTPQLRRQAVYLGLDLPHPLAIARRRGRVRLLGERSQ